MRFRPAIVLALACVAFYSAIILSTSMLVTIESRAMAKMAISKPQEVADPYSDLYDIITERKAEDGSVVTPESEAPRLWADSRYLVEDGAHAKLLDALERVLKLPEV
jgi:hypothetical protein